MSIPSFAGNNDSIPSYGYSGKGDDLWKYNNNYSAIRISLYWAPDSASFESGTDVIQLGKTTDVSKTGPWYRVGEYTGYSIYWYMNKNNMHGTEFNSIESRNVPYVWVGKGEVCSDSGQDIVEKMPDVWTGTKVQWDNWFEGPIINGTKTYQNIPEIARLCGANITTEDFKNGINAERGFKSKPGVYKIFFEPVIYPIVDGIPMAITLRDLIRWEESFCRGDIFTSDGKDLINWITPVFVFTANSQFLIENEDAISMYGKNSMFYRKAYEDFGHPLFEENLSKVNTYSVIYNSQDINIRRQQRAEIKNQLNPLGGIIYNSMGTGVVTTEGVSEPDTVDDNPTNDSNTIEYASMSFDGFLKAAPRDNEPFDVTKSIPSGEAIYAQVIADSYLYRLSVRSVKGKVNTNVTVNHFDEEGNPKTTKVSVSRSYSYQEVTSFELYSIKEALIENRVLPDGKVYLSPSNLYKQPQIQTTPNENDKFSYHLSGYRSNRTISSQAVTPEEVYIAAQEAVPSPKAKSDKLIINGETIMDSQTGNILFVEPKKTERDVLYEPNLLIPESTSNGQYESTGSITYQKVYSYNPKNPDNLTFSLNNVNPVIIHTPICVDLKISSDDIYNQNPSPKNVSSLILGRPFTLNISNRGTHKNIKGYGSRDFTKYINNREVRFEFDVYLGSNRSGKYLKANTWHSLNNLNISNSTSEITFYTPAWVDVGTYNVEVKSIASNNADNCEKSEFKANLNPVNTIAFHPCEVEVSGRIYDLAITDIDDIGWELFFRENKGSSTSTGKVFYTGPKDINGNINDKRKYFMPVTPGKNDVNAYQNRAVKLGYAFKFEIKTIGNFYNKDDFLRINPTFVFVDKEGQNRTEVDLYYSIPEKPLIKVGSPQDTLITPIKLNFEYRGINIAKFKNTSGAIYRLCGGIEGFTPDKWTNSFVKLSQGGVPTYKYTEILLSEPLRTFIGPTNNIPAQVNIDKAFASAQKWYGEYGLPNDCLIVPKGTDLSKERNLTRSSPLFLKEGYLIVNFADISVIQNSNFDNPILQYTGKTGDGWLLEGYDTSQGGGQLVKGDVLAYYANMRSTEDYIGTGTH